MSSHTFPLPAGVKSQPNLEVFPAGTVVTPTIVHTFIKSHGDGSNNTNYTTSPPSPTFQNDRLYLAIVAGRAAAGGAVSVSSVAGGGLTWVKVAEVQFKTIATPDSVVAVFRAMVAAGAGTGNITFIYSVTVQTGLISISEFDNVVTGGTDGDTAIVQSATFSSDGTSSPVVALAPFGGPKNATYGAFSNGEGAGTFTAGAGFNPITVPSGTMLAEERNDNDQTVDASLSVGGHVGAIGIEIAAS